jgi:hypothetical protein
MNYLFFEGAALPCCHITTDGFAVCFWGCQAASNTLSFWGQNKNKKANTQGKMDWMC